VTEEELHAKALRGKGRKEEISNGRRPHAKSAKCAKNAKQNFSHFAFFASLREV
jgi:hypothetical protein